jgi:hypothetical protein
MNDNVPLLAIFSLWDPNFIADQYGFSQHFLSELGSAADIFVSVDLGNLHRSLPYHPLSVPTDLPILRAATESFMNGWSCHQPDPKNRAWAAHVLPTCFHRDCSGFMAKILYLTRPSPFTFNR